MNVDDHVGDVVFRFSLHRMCDQSVGGSLGSTSEAGTASISSGERVFEETA
jgi:hypothetical protein